MRMQFQREHSMDRVTRCYYFVLASNVQCALYSRLNMICAIYCEAIGFEHVCVPFCNWIACKQRDIFSHITSLQLDIKYISSAFVFVFLLLFCRWTFFVGYSCCGLSWCFFHFCCRISLTDILRLRWNEREKKKYISHACVQAFFSRFLLLLLLRFGSFICDTIRYCRFARTCMHAIQTVNVAHFVRITWRSFSLFGYSFVCWLWKSIFQWNPTLARCRFAFHIVRYCARM